MGDEIDKDKNLAPELIRTELEKYAYEILANPEQAERITPVRLVTRPDSTREHLITEAELTKLENCGDGGFNTKASFALGGALSTFIPFCNTVWNYISLPKVPNSATIVDIVTIITFIVFLVLGIVFWRETKDPKKNIGKVCNEIRKRPEKKLTDLT